MTKHKHYENNLTEIQRLILTDKKILDGSEKNHLLSVFDVFKHSTEALTILYNMDVEIRFLFKCWKGWSWNDVLLLNLSRMNQLQAFSSHLSYLRQDLLGLDNLPENSSISSYIVAISRYNNSFEYLLSSFCSKELKAKFEYLVLGEEIKPHEDKKHVTKI